MVEIDITTRSPRAAVEDPQLDALVSQGWRIGASWLVEQEHATTGQRRQILALLMEPPSSRAVTVVLPTVLVRGVLGAASLAAVASVLQLLASFGIGV